MSLTVGELVAYIRADGSQFDRQVDQSGTKFQALGRTVAAGTKALATAFVAVTTAAVGVGAAVLKVGLDYNRMQQASRAALTTLLGSAEAVNAQMDKLDAFARTSPFSKQVFIAGQQQLLAFGIAAEKVIPTLDAMQNAVAASGGGTQQLSELISIFAKISAAGKLTAQDFIEFGNRGIDAATLIGLAMGKTGAEIRSEVTLGTLDAGVALDALVAGTQARFGGATALIKEQFNGAIDRVKAASRDIGGILAAPFIDPQGGGRAVVWANKVADALRALQDKAGPLVDIIVKRFSPALDAVVPLLDRIRGAINSWDLSKVNGQLDAMGSYAPLIASTSAALFALGTKNFAPLQALGISGLNPVVAGIVALVAASPQMRAAGEDFLDALEPLIPIGRELGRTVADTAMEVLRTLTPAMRDLLLATAPLIVAVGRELSPALLATVRAAEPLARVLASVAEEVGKIPAPVLAAAAAWALLHGPLSGLTTSIVSQVVPAFGIMRETVLASAATAEAMGTKATIMGTTMLTARVGVMAVGTALKTAFLSNPIGIAILAITTALGFFMQQQAEAKQRVEDFKDSLDKTTGAITADTRALVVHRLETDGLLKVYGDLGGKSGDLVNAVLDVGDGYDVVTKKLHEYDTAQTGVNGVTWQAMDKGARRVSDAISGMQGDLENASDSAIREAQALDGSTGATGGATDAAKAHADALKAEATAMQDAADVALSLREAQLAAEDGQTRFNDAVARAAEVNADETASAEDKAAALRDVESALLDQVHRYQAVDEAMVKQNESASALDATIRTQREAFIANAVEMGKTREEAGRLATQYGLIPDRVYTKMIADVIEAQGTITRFIEGNDGKRIKVTVDTVGGVTYRYTPNGPAAQANGGVWDGKVKTFANGGMNAAGRYVPRTSQIAKGGDNILWAEPETGWEAYISGKPSERLRNLSILDQAASRLGRITVPAGTSMRASGSITPGGAGADRGSLVGLVLEGTLDLGNGLVGQMRGVVRDELAAAGAAATYRGRA